MFKKLYAQKLMNGDRTSLAYQVGKSEEWISRLTRYAGEPCPAEKYFRWYCALHQVNPDAADALHESLNLAVGEARREVVDLTWCPRTSAASLLVQAAATVNALNHQGGSNDEPALMDLLLQVQSALEACRSKREVS